MRIWKSALLLFVIALLLSLTGCPPVYDDVPMEGDTGEESTEEGVLFDYIADYSEITFDEAVARSDCAAVGRLLSFEMKDGYIECEFAVLEVLRGDIWEDAICLRTRARAAEGERFSLSEDFSSGTYTVDEEYILVLSKAGTSEEVWYGCVCGAYIPVRDPGQSMMCEKPLTEISGMNAEAIKLRIRRGY